MRPARLILLLLLLAVAAAALPPGMSEIAPGLYRYQDTVNVYAVVRNGKALLIDFGSGGILAHLDALGVRQVDWLVHTHFHRDQNQGDALAIARGIRIAVPAAERKYFESAEEMWQEKKVFHLYDLRNEFFAPRANIRVDRGLEPNTSFEWEGLELQVVASPDTRRDRCRTCSNGMERSTPSAGIWCLHRGRSPPCTIWNGLTSAPVASRPRSARST
jgi:hypothetical protein